MTWMRRVAAGVLAAGLGAGFVAVRAEDPAPKSDEGAPAAPEPEKPKEKFFGDRFAMYLEVRGGISSMDDFEAPVTSNLSSASDNVVSFDSGQVGQFTIGWTLPRDRGQYLLTFTGIADGDYALRSSGRQKSLIFESGNPQTPNDLLPWWELEVQNGVLHSTQTPPVWNQELDDSTTTGTIGFPDSDEIRYPTTTFDLSTTVPSDLRNSLQTWDLYYRREFGGINIRSRWTAGLRYLDFEGSVPMAAWLTGIVQDGVGYSDGVQNRLLLNQLSTTGWGPVGSGEVQFNFFRKRLTLYAMAQIAFLIEKVKSDSGAFTYLATDQGGTVYLPGSGRITGDVSKTAWNTTFEAGLRCRVLDGFHIIVDWNTTGYLDTLLIPYQLSLPSLQSQVSQGTTALYASRDIVTSSINFGLSFQF